MRHFRTENIVTFQLVYLVPGVECMLLSQDIINTNKLYNSELKISFDLFSFPKFGEGKAANLPLNYLKLDKMFLWINM